MANELEVLKRNKCFLSKNTLFTWLTKASFKNELKNENAEAYLKPSRTSAMQLFCKNSQQLEAINFFRKKPPSEIFDWVLNTPLE